MKHERNLASILFLLCVTIRYAFSFAASYSEAFRDAVINMNWGLSSVFTELAIVLPGLLILGIWYVIQEYKESADEEFDKPLIWDRLMLNRVKISTLLMTVLLTFLIMPLSTLANYISMQFVDNVLINETEDMLNLSIGPAIILISVFGPMCEEFVFRGMIFGGYRKACSVLSSVVVSGLLFGLMHLNFNQFGYAFVIGIWLAIVVEATGSIWPAVLIHFIINFRSTASIFLFNFIDRDTFSDIDMNIIRGKEYRIFFLIYAVFAVITSAVAGAIANWLAKNEGRPDAFKEITRKTSKGTKAIIITPSLVIGIAMAFAYMIIDVLA